MVQITDRWHLLRNGAEALCGVLEHHHHDLREAAQAAAPLALPPASDTPTTAPEPEPHPEPSHRLRAADRRSQAPQNRHFAGRYGIVRERRSRQRRQDPPTTAPPVSEKTDANQTRRAADVTVSGSAVGQCARHPHRRRAPPRQNEE